MYVNIFEEKEIKKREKRLRFLDVKRNTKILEHIKLLFVL
jgi:hypothetical protein